MSGVEVVELAPADWERWRTIRLRSLVDAPDAFWSTLADEADNPPGTWREWLGRDSSSVYVVVRDGVDIGCVVAAVHHAFSDLAGLYAMWVAPEGRGAGAGDVLVNAVIGWAKDQGFRAMRFDVADANDHARALYARHGAVPTGDRATFPPPRDHIAEHELEILL